ncbi:transposase [Candidatus Symbiothrix dinenymphae]|nr:transposase [Candidatus Symbiothrix dinenymphae]
MDIEILVKTLIAEVRTLQKENELQKKAIEIQDKEIADLRARLSRYEHPKTSQNSHLPPCKDPIGTQKVNLRQKTGRPVGGQKGHVGKTLTMQKPDEIIGLCSDFCTHCGADLSAKEASLLEIRQEIDLPPIRPIVKEYHKMRKVCQCGWVNDGEFPVGVNSRISYGSGVEAAVTYFNIRQRLPYQRLTDTMNEFCGLSMSPGTIGNILDRMVYRTSPAFETIRLGLTTSPVIGADETTCSVNGKTMWAWVIQNKQLTYIKAGLTRKKEEFEKMMPEGLPMSVLVTDCLAGYFSANVKTHQICTSHILRDLIYASQLYANQTWSKRMKKLILDALQLRKDAVGKIDTTHIQKRLQVLIDEPIDTAHEKIKALQKRLIKYRDYLFYFLEDENVPPDNNASERAIRAFKIKLKNSGCFRSLTGAQGFAQLHSIADTACKNGQSPLLAFQIAATIR